MRRIVVSSIVVLVVVGFVTAGYFFYSRYSGEVTEAIKAVPQDAAFVIECRSTQNTLFNLKQTEYWQKISASPSMKQFRESLTHIDSVFSNDADFSSSWKKKPVIISAHVTKADDFDWLFLFETPRGANEKDAAGLIKKILSASGTFTRREYEDVFIYEITTNAGRSFSFALHKGILMCSYTPFLVEAAISQLKSGYSLQSDKSFFTIYKTSGKDTDASLYFNYKSFGRFLSIFCSQSPDNASYPEFSSLSSLADWSEGDIKFIPSALLMDGYAAIKDTNQWMSVMKNQQPQEMRMADILPARTAYLLHFGFSDAKTFFERLQFSGRNGETSQNLPGSKKRKNVSFNKNLTSWIGGEMALAITESNTANYANNIFACVEARDTVEAMNELKEIALAEEPVKSADLKMEEYHGHRIGLIKREGILKAVYGKLFEGIQKNYFTSVGSYIVFANQASSLRSFIDDADSKKNLASDNAYKQTLANSESSSNLFVYMNIPRSLNVLRSMSSDTMIQVLDDRNSAANPAYNGLSAIALQYNNKGSLIYNHFVIQFSEGEKRSVSLVWSAQCDTSIHMKPQVVNDGSADYFMVQDDANHLYLFDVSGQLLWKKQLEEKIIGDIHSVDFFHNGTQQFLFNTSSSLYLIDKSGAYLGNYPIRLPAAASNACTVVDFDNNRSYKIFVACNNQMLYAYEINGKPMDGWLYNKPAGTISHPLLYFKVNDKDYLVIATADGRIELLDRKGALRAKAAEKIMVSPLSKIVPLDTGDASLAHAVLADTAGNVFSVYTDGHMYRIFNNHLTPPVFFDAADINNDSKPEYILFGSNTISVQEGDSSLLYSHEFKDAPPGLSVCVFGGLVGNVSPAANEITIYNEDGTIYPGFPVKGSTVFTAAMLNNDSRKYIAAGSSDGNLYLYVME